MNINILKAESTNKAIVVSISLSLIAKSSTFIQSLVVSYAFGTQISTDIFFYALSFITLLSVLIDSITYSIIVPNAISIRNSTSEQESKAFVFFIYLIFLLIGAVTTAFLFGFSEQVVGLLSKFDNKNIQENAGIINMVLLSFFFIMLNTYILNIFTSYKYFSLPMIVEVLKNGLVILFILILKDSFSVFGLAIGLLAATFVQFLILNVLMFKVLGIKLSAKYYRVDHTVKKNILYVVCSKISAFVFGVLSMNMMTGFNAGVYTSMDYSQKINTIFSSVFINQLCTVIGIKIIDLHSKKNFEKLNRVFEEYFRLSLVVLTPICFILCLNSKEIISLLFFRGKFTMEDVLLTSAFFKYFILVIPFMLVNNFVVRLTIAKQVQRVSFLWSIFQSMLMLVMMYIFVEAFGFIGYPVAYLISFAVYMYLNFKFFVRKEFEYIDSNGLVRFLFLNILVNSLLLVPFEFLLERLKIRSLIHYDLILMIFSSCAYLVGYLLIGLRIKAYRDVFSKLLNVAKNKAGRLGIIRVST